MGVAPKEDLFQSLFSLEGKTVVVTGACGFLGNTMVGGLLEAGARVVMMSRSDAIQEESRRYANNFGKDKVGSYQVDFYNRNALEETLNALLDHESPDGLINNAYDMGARTGLNASDGNLEQAPFEQWQCAFESGIFWAVRATQRIGSRMRSRKLGSIVNISSMYGIVSPDPTLYEGTEFHNPPTYSVNKAGLIALTRYTAAFWGTDNVRCNAIAPGPFSNTQGGSENAVGKGDPFLERLAQRTLLKRIGSPGELVGAIIFLLSDASSYVTGQTLVVDGGWTAT